MSTECVETRDIFQAGPDNERSWASGMAMAQNGDAGNGRVGCVFVELIFDAQIFLPSVNVHSVAETLGQKRRWPNTAGLAQIIESCRYRPIRLGPSAKSSSSPMNVQVRVVLSIARAYVLHFAPFGEFTREPQGAPHAYTPFLPSRSFRHFQHGIQFPTSPAGIQPLHSLAVAGNGRIENSLT
jgi:hypothetical protein